MSFFEEKEIFRRESSIRYMDLEEESIYTPVFESLCLIDVKTSAKYALHRHPKFEIFIPETMDYECLLNDQVLHVPKGEVLIVQIGDLHQDYFIKNGKHSVITFDIHVRHDLATGNSIFRQGISPERQVVKRPTDPIGENCLRLMKKELNNESEHAYYVLNGVFQAYFWKVMALIPKESLSIGFMEHSKRDEFKTTLIDYFQKNMDRKLMVKEIAKALGMSESSLAHKCLEYLGVSPAKAFTAFKMRRAADMLRKTGVSVKEVSDIFKFENQFHFSRTFKKVFSVSPSAYQKQFKV